MLHLPVDLSTLLDQGDCVMAYEAATNRNIEDSDVSIEQTFLEA